jgi:hypothetical protein
MSVGLARRAARPVDEMGKNDQTKEDAKALGSGSNGTSPLSSTTSSSSDLKGMDLLTGSKGKSLADRSRIPPSAYVTYGSILLLQYFSGMWKLETLESWFSSIVTSAVTCRELLGYARDLTKSAYDGEYHAWTEYARTAVVLTVAMSLIYLFVVAPFKAGLWTGHKARKHKFHRYMGLLYLIQYFFAWVEFITNYSNGSVLAHFVALNGKFCWICWHRRRLGSGFSHCLLRYRCYCRNSSGIIRLFFVQSLARAGGRRIHLGQGCTVKKLYSREHLFHSHGCLWLCLLQP